MAEPSDGTPVDFRSGIRERRLVGLYDYWQAKRGARAMPGRADIDPIEMKPWLGNLMLIEFFGDVHRYRIRVDGSNLSEMGGRGRTGKGIESLTDAAERKLLMQQYGRVLAERRPFYYESEFTNSEERHLRESKLLLPLSADGETVNMVLAGIYYRNLQRKRPTEDAAVG